MLLLSNQYCKTIDELNQFDLFDTFLNKMFEHKLDADKFDTCIPGTFLHREQQK